MHDSKKYVHMLQKNSTNLYFAGIIIGLRFSNDKDEFFKRLLDRKIPFLSINEFKQCIGLTLPKFLLHFKRPIPTNNELIVYYESIH